LPGGRWPVALRGTGMLRKKDGVIKAITDNGLCYSYLPCKTSNIQAKIRDPRIGLNPL
jgi:hypothetical protein